MLPGNLTLCHCPCLLEGFSCRAQSQPRDAFPSLGSLFHTACLVVQLSKTVAGWKWLFRPHSQQFNTQARATAASVQGGHCPHRPRPTKCEKLCSTASASCTETHSRFHHDQRENGVPDPHTTELTLSASYHQLPTSHTKARESTAVIHTLPNTAAATPGRQRTRRTRKSITPQNSKRDQTLSNTRAKGAEPSHVLTTEHSESESTQRATERHMNTLTTRRRGATDKQACIQTCRV